MNYIEKMRGSCKARKNVIHSTYALLTKREDMRADNAKNEANIQPSLLNKLGQ